MKVNRHLIGIIVRSIHSKSKQEVVLREFKFQSTNKALHDLLITMPKEQGHIPILRSARIQKKDTKARFPAGFINLEVLGSGSKGAPASLYIFTDQTRYLFNCGEGTQRLAHEHKMKLSKLEHIFLTNSTWKNFGGIPGLALTIQDIGVPSITLHGPPGLQNLFEGTRRFVILKDLQIRVSDCVNDSEGFYEDHVMRIEYIPLTRSGIEVEETSESLDALSDKEEVDETDYYEAIKGCKRNLEITQVPKKSKVDNEREGTTEKEKRSSTAVCYICRPKQKAGALMIEKCIEMGVPSGPLLGMLKRGEDVTLPNGNIVRAEAVRSPDAPSTVFLVIDCPTVEHLDALTSNEKLKEYHGDISVDNFVHAIIHFTPKEVFQHARYVEWMRQFRISTKHILLNEMCKGMGSDAVHRVQYKLNLLDPEIFPLLSESSERGEEEQKCPNEQVSFNPQVPLIHGVTQFRYKLRPEIGMDTSTQVKISPKEYIKEVMELPEFSNALESLKSQFANQAKSSIEYPNIVFLGTGSCIPNKTRNTSGILVQVSESAFMILDCGEGSYGQIVRFFGSDKTNHILTHLNGIYVSHLHADHHLGLFNLLQQREVAFSQKNVPFRPVFLIAPQQIESWLKLYHRSFEQLKHLYKLVPSTNLLHQNSSLDTSFASVFYKTLGVSQIETVNVRHCPNAYGVAVTGTNGWKVTYSGDTMPTDYLVTLGKDSDLLIHEATMEDELKDEAELKMHSTTSEAIEIGKKMNAKFIMLTHFSQRYAKVPKINGELEKNVGIAFDNMSVQLGNLWKIPMMYPVLKTMFAESYEDMEAKTARKIRRKERDMKRASIGI